MSSAPIASDRNLTGSGIAHFPSLTGGANTNVTCPASSRAWHWAGVMTLSSSVPCCGASFACARTARACAEQPSAIAVARASACTRVVRILFISSQSRASPNRGLSPPFLVAPGLEGDDLVVAAGRAARLVAAGHRDVAETRCLQGQLEFADAPPAHGEQLQLGVDEVAVAPMFVAQIGDRSLGQVVDVGVLVGEGEDVAVGGGPAAHAGVVEEAAQGFEIEEQAAAGLQVIVKAAQHGQGLVESGDELEGAEREDDGGEAAVVAEILEAHPVEGRRQAVGAAVGAAALQHLVGGVEALDREACFQQRNEEAAGAARRFQDRPDATRDPVAVELDVAERAARGLVEIVDPGGQAAVAVLHGVFPWCERGLPRQCAMGTAHASTGLRPAGDGGRRLRESPATSRLKAFLP